MSQNFFPHKVRQMSKIIQEKKQDKHKRKDLNINRNCKKVNGLERNKN